MRFGRALGVVCSIPKSLYFNFAYLPLRQALRLPFLIHWRTRVVQCSRGCLKLGDSGRTRFCQIRVGFPHRTYPSKPSVLNLTGSVTFLGDCSLLTGIDLNVSGDLRLGHNLRCNEAVKIDCASESAFGSDVIVGANCYFSDSDGHAVCDLQGVTLNPNAGFSIGDHVWFGRGCLTLKGVHLGPDVIVGAGSVVTRSCTERNVVIAGNPVRVLKRDVQWLA